MEFLVYRTLAEHDPRAVRPALTHAAAAMGLRATKGQERSTLLDLVTLASVQWLAGEPEAAREAATAALAKIGDTSSHRTWDRLRQMYRLSEPYAGERSVAELRAQIRAAVPPSRRPAE
jgi:hypothetical protein